MAFQKRALIDLGSNSIRLVVYRLTKKGTFKETLNEKRTARITLHVDEHKNITAKGIEKIIDTLHYFNKIALQHQVRDIQCFATACLRDASNQKYVLKKIKNATNIRVEVLTGREEAYYGFIGAIQTSKLRDGVTIDIGGGSTEVTLFENRTLKYAHSFPFGAVTLTQKYIKGKNPTKKELKQLSTFLFEQFSRLPWLRATYFPVIGIGGTARNVQKVFDKNNVCSHNDEKSKMNIDDVQMTSTYLQSFTLRKREKISGLSKERADIIIPGMEAIYQLMQVVQAPSFEASNQGLREGLCYSERFTDSVKAK